MRQDRRDLPTQRQLLIAAALRITHQQACVIELLLSHPLVTLDMLRALIPNHVPTAMHRMRQKLKAAGHGFEVDTQYGSGYSLPPDARKTIVGLIRKFNQPSEQDAEVMESA
jgi:hypothetical protein